MDGGAAPGAEPGLAPVPIFPAFRRLPPVPAGLAGGSALDGGCLPQRIRSPASTRVFWRRLLFARAARLLALASAPPYLRPAACFARSAARRFSGHGSQNARPSAADCLLHRMQSPASQRISASRRERPRPWARALSVSLRGRPEVRSLASLARLARFRCSHMGAFSLPWGNGRGTPGRPGWAGGTSIGKALSRPACGGRGGPRNRTPGLFLPAGAKAGAQDDLDALRAHRLGFLARDHGAPDLAPSLRVLLAVPDRTNVAAGQGAESLDHEAVVAFEAAAEIVDQKRARRIAGHRRCCCRPHRAVVKPGSSAPPSEAPTAAPLTARPSLLPARSGGVRCSRRQADGRRHGRRVPGERPGHGQTGTFGL